MVLMDGRTRDSANTHAGSSLRFAGGASHRRDLYPIYITSEIESWVLNDIVSHGPEFVYNLQPSRSRFY